MSKRRKIVLGVLAALGLLIGGGAAYVLHVAGKALSNQPGRTQSVSQTVNDIWQAIKDPRSGFPNQDKVTILCMGIDDNWTNTDQVYTKDARTDTLFLLTLDLANQKASMLSIPRDTYCHIAGTDWRFKINAAYQTGGPQRAIDTVDELLGVRADHFLVLNIDATKRMVDALGGVDVDVEHPMRYNDDWGHLHIDLKPGLQHLNGEQAVGFARYRHPDAGQKPTPEDGDERRMYRQHVLLKAMIARAKSPENLSQPDRLINVAMENVRTDLTRAQLLDLAAIYRTMAPEQIRTASLVGEDFRGPKGEWFYRLDPEMTKAYVDWLVHDDPTSIDHASQIVIKNGTKTPGLAQKVVDLLKSQGFANVANGGNVGAKSAVPQTAIFDSGVPDPSAAGVVAQSLGVQAAVERKRLKPNKIGWTPPPSLTITLGDDYAQTVKAANPV